MCEFWNAQVCHTLCDGSPAHLEDEVERALQRWEPPAISPDMRSRTSMFSHFSIAVSLSYIKLDERQTGLSNFRSMKFIGLSLVLVECVTCSSKFRDWIILNTTNVFFPKGSTETQTRSWGEPPTRCSGCTGRLGGGTFFEGTQSSRVHRKCGRNDNIERWKDWSKLRACSSSSSSGWSINFPETPNTIGHWKIGGNIQRTEKIA